VRDFIGAAVDAVRFSGPAAVFIFGSERTASSSAAHEFKLCRELRKFEAVCAAAGPEVL